MSIEHRSEGATNELQNEILRSKSWKKEKKDPRAGGVIRVTEMRVKNNNV